MLRVDDFGSPPGGHRASRMCRIDGKSIGRAPVPVGKDTRIQVPIAHGGENVIELEARPGPAELTLENNRAVVVVVNGVRDRLRVLLVSGEPNAGERVWRNLLKADPSVDLVHFTILRPPDKQDATPIDELSLIVFPTRELFREKLDQFDLVIFDRYQRARHSAARLFREHRALRRKWRRVAGVVRTGIRRRRRASFARRSRRCCRRSPTGEIVTEAFKPMVTPQGLAHPVTRDLPGANDGTKAAELGPLVPHHRRQQGSGQTVMSGPNDRPLLVLDSVGKGRVAELLSDQVWLWARGFEGGGPQAELLRRLAHWLMKEPELEEERLSASIDQRTDHRRAPDHGRQPKPVTLTYPSGKTLDVDARARSSRACGAARAKADELGLYRLTDGTFNTVTATGPLNPKEVADMRATDAILKPVASATGGSVHWLADGGIPTIRRVGARRRAARRQLDRPARQRRLSRDIGRAAAAAARRGWRCCSCWARC